MGIAWPLSSPYIHAAIGTTALYWSLLGAVTLTRHFNVGNSFPTPSFCSLCFGRLGMILLETDIPSSGLRYTWLTIPRLIKWAHVSMFFSFWFLTFRARLPCWKLYSSRWNTVLFSTVSNQLIPTLQLTALRLKETRLNTLCMAAPFFSEGKYSRCLVRGFSFSSKIQLDIFGVLGKLWDPTRWNFK